MAEKINWDEATKSSNFVMLESGKKKILILENARLDLRDKDVKIAPGKIEFIADVVEDDNEEVVDKLFTSTSKRLMTCLRPIFEDKNGSIKQDKIKISVKKIGEQFNTQYDVEELPLSKEEE